MACFGLDWIERLCIFLVILFALIAIIKLLLPLITMTPVVAQIITIILWAAVSIFIIMIIFTLLSCMFSGSGMGNIGLLPHR